MTKGTVGHRTAGRRGAVLPFTVICMFMFMGFAALAIDLGYLYVVESELQKAADNGALGGAKEYADEAIVYGTGSIYETLATVRSQSKYYVNENPAGGKSIVLEDGKMVLGYLSDIYDRSLTIDPTASSADFNAIQVTTRRTADSPNGAVGLFFARVFGIQTSDLTATATAALDDRFQGIEVPDGSNSPLIPFAIRADDWQHEIVNGNGNDNYSIDPEDGSVSNSSDNIPEIRLYTETNLSNNGHDDGTNIGAGNYGVLNIGVFSNSEAIVEDQILDGITGEQVYMEFGQNHIDVYSDSGSLLSYQVTGNPGIQVGMKDEFEARLGEVVGFFVYDELVSGTGDNTIFNIVGIQFGRVMLIQLTGNDKRVLLQPAAFVGSNVRTSTNAPSTNGLIAKLQLIR